MTGVLRVTRLPNNPIIRPNMDDRMGSNINGPSLIRIPEWIENPLGKYYLYFGHHDGKFIRLAYSDDLIGPWHTYRPGTLQLDDSHFTGHIGSPDVHVDDSSRQIRMYFHGSDTATGQGGKQSTRLAISADGLSFLANRELLGNPYWRVFHWKRWCYALGMPGVFYRSKNGVSNFEQGPMLFSTNMRHSAVLVEGDDLHVYYTDVGDAPERIRRTTISLSDHWANWRLSKPVDILSPQEIWEGANQPVAPSKRGLIEDPVNQLRDPVIFREDGHTYLLYSVAGESGIAVAKLT